MYWMSLYLPIIILGIAFWEQVGRECSRVNSTSVLFSYSSVQVNPGQYSTSLYCDYNLTSGDITLSIEIKRRRSGEPFITIATFYELETLPATYTLNSLDLKGRTSLTNPDPMNRRAVLHFIYFKHSDEADYHCTLTVAKPLEGNLQISSDIIRLSFAEYMSDKYSTKMPIRNGTIYLLDVDNTDEANYSIRYDVGNISIWHKLNLQVLVAPSTECRPDITFKDNILTASLNPEKCGKPSVSVSWLENPDIINEGKTIATMIPERKARKYHACIEGPAIRCLKNLKISYYCSAFAINESNLPSEAFESSLRCDGFVATIFMQCIVLTIVVSDLLLHVYEFLHKRKKNRRIMESDRDTAGTPVISRTNEMTVLSGSESISPMTTIDLQERRRGRKTEPVNQELGVPSPSPETDNEEERTYHIPPTYFSRHQSGGDEYIHMESIHRNIPTQ